MTHYLNATALLRLSILGPLASRDHFEVGELKRVIKQLAAQTYTTSHGTAKFSEKTIERWYYCWKKQGIDGLVPVIRSDKNSCQLNETVQEAIVNCKKDNPARSIRSIIHYLELEGTVQKGRLSRATVHRLLQRHDLSQRVMAGADTIERRAFESVYAGDLWYSDVMHGPTIQTREGRRKVYLISVMDDASRLICHSAFCLDETAVSVESVLKDALLKRGLPKKLLIDNGPAYRSESLQQVCARLKIRLIYSRPYEPQSKAKLERWHLSVRNQFLTEVDFSAIHSLSELNARWWVWLEQYYHKTPHSALKNSDTQEHITPLARFQQDLLKMQPLGDAACRLDDYFYHRFKRAIKKDGTLSFNGRLFEVPFEYVGQTVYLVIDPVNETPKYIESLNHERLGDVHPLDKHANNERKRHRPIALKPEQPPKTSFVETLYHQHIGEK